LRILKFAVYYKIILQISSTINSLNVKIICIADYSLIIKQPKEVIMAKKAKIIKKIFIIFFSVILGIFVLLLAAPLLFKNQLMELAKTELNKILLAKVDFKDLKLSFIRSFPDAYIALEGAEVTGVDDFDGELLASFDSFSVTADILSVIKMNFDIKSVLLVNASLNGRILKDGRANWMIVRTSEKPEQVSEEEIETEKESESFSLPFNAKLKKLEIRNLKAAFRDDSRDLTASLEALNFILRGDMTKNIAGLNLELFIDGVDFWMGGVRMANNADIGFISEVAADLVNLDFTLKDNRFNLNDFVLKFEGSAGLKDSGITADLTFAAERTDFKSLLSLIPAVYMSSFSDLQTTGSLDLNGGIKGTLGEGSMPSASVNLAVYNAAFSYPQLPKSVQGINIALRAFYDGEVFDRSTVDLDRLSFYMAGNPFNAEVHVRTPESDMQVSASFNGIIDIDSITDIIPLQDMTLSGLLECDVALSGRLSTLENEQYEDFQLGGNLNLSRFNFETPAFAYKINLNNAHLNFTPRRVELENFDAVIGSSDIRLSGTLENFIPFILKNDTVRGTLALGSNMINLNEFMSGGPKEKKEEEAETEKESASLRVIEVTKNIDFALNVNIANILFDKLAVTNTTGAVTVKDGRVMMQNLALNLLNGSMTLNGQYNTQDMITPFINFDLDIRQFDISSALSSFAILERFLPEPQNYTGRVSASLNISSILGDDMMPLINSISSRGRLQTQGLQIRNSKIFGTIADLIKNENWRTPSPDNVDIGYRIADGRLYLEPSVVFNIESARMEISGDQGLDMTMNYRVSANMPVSIIGADAVNILNRIPGGSRVNEIRLTGYVRGDVKNPEISLGIADMAGAVVDMVREQVTETITQAVEEVTAQVNEEINRQIDQLMAEANRQADNIRSAARQTADRLRNEANTAANKLISDAAAISNPIQRLAAQAGAQAAADLTRREGENAARRIEQEAENQIQLVLDEAQRRAGELRRD